MCGYVYMTCGCTCVYLFFLSPRTQGTPYRGSWGKKRINSKTACVRYVHDVCVRTEGVDDALRHQPGRTDVESESASKRNTTAGVMRVSVG